MNQALPQTSKDSADTWQSLEVSEVREVIVKYKSIHGMRGPKRIQNSEDFFKAFKKRMNVERVETFQTILVNAKNEFMAIDVVSRGSLSSATVHPREVFTVPVRLQAAALLFMHNHTSGDPAPSREDLDCTRRLVHAGNILGIRILDHIVFGENDYYSFADSGKLAAMQLETYY